MNHLKAVFLASTAHELRGIFRPTPKNPPAAGFYEREGFRLAEEREGGERVYVLGREEAAPAECGWIEVVEAGG